MSTLTATQADETKPNKRQRVLEILKDAYNQKVNLGTQPDKPPAGHAHGWVTGLYLTMHGAGARYGARIHELRHGQGIAILCHEERRGGDTIPFYRLDLPDVTESPRPSGNLFGDAPPNDYGRI